MSLCKCGHARSQHSQGPCDYNGRVCWCGKYRKKKPGDDFEPGVPISFHDDKSLGTAFVEERFDSPEGKQLNEDLYRLVQDYQEKEKKS